MYHRRAWKFKSRVKGTYQTVLVVSDTLNNNLPTPHFERFVDDEQR